jgi:hypothetical protein
MLGWFYALLRGRIPRGLRDLIAYALSYSAQLWAYLLVLTDRYPSSNPLTAIGPLPTRTDPIQLEVGDDLRRSRLTVFFRLPLTIPHLAWLLLWTIAVFPVAIVNWFATLVRRESPRALHGFLAKYLRYQLHVFGFLGLIANPFPGFTGVEGRYPLDLKIDDPAAQNRWAVFARLILALPAALLAAAFQSLLSVVALLGWFTALFTGKVPRGLRNAGALALRYTAQTNGYLLLVTGSYPYSGPSLTPPTPSVAATPATSPAPAV